MVASTLSTRSHERQCRDGVVSAQGIVVGVGALMCAIGSWFAHKFYKGEKLPFELLAPPSAAEAEEAADADLTRAQEARLRAQAAAKQHAATLRGAAESALGKTPAWVFLCDPFSFVSFGPKSRELSGALRWGDGALADLEVEGTETATELAPLLPAWPHGRGGPGSSQAAAESLEVRPRAPEVKHA